MNSEPIILTREQHINEIMRNIRMKRMDAIADEVIFNDKLDRVANAMREPPYELDKTVTAIWGGYFFFMAFGTLLLWEMIR